MLRDINNIAFLTLQKKAHQVSAKTFICFIRPYLVYLWFSYFSEATISVATKNLLGRRYNNIPVFYRPVISLKL